MNEEKRVNIQAKYDQMIVEKNQFRKLKHDIFIISNRISYPINLETLSLGKIEHHDVKQVRTRDVIDSSNYIRARRATAAYLAIKQTSETLRFSSKSTIRNHVQLVFGYALAKSRFSS